jgi:hypothetical protein
MKVMTLLAVSLFAFGAFGQNGARPFLLVDVSGNPYPNGNGTPLPYTPPSMICYTLSAGSILPCNFAAGGGGDTITSPNSTLNVGGTAAATTLDINLAKSLIWTASGALSAPAVLYNGLPVITGGTGTTTWPMVLIQPSGTTTTTWSNVGTYFGINAASGFTGNIMDIQANGTSRFSVTNGGTANIPGTVSTGAYHSTNTCGSTASPAVCGGNIAGAVAVPVAGTTLVVNTTAVTVNSQILLTFDSSLGTKLTATCNTAINQPTVSARTAGTSFTITMASALTTNPDCISFVIIN